MLDLSMSSLEPREAHLEWSSDLQGDGRVGLPAVAHHIHCGQGGPGLQLRQRIGARHNMVARHRRAHCGTLGKEITDRSSACAVALQPLHVVCSVHGASSGSFAFIRQGHTLRHEKQTSSRSNTVLESVQCNALALDVVQLTSVLLLSIACARRGHVRQKAHRWERGGKSRVHWREHGDVEERVVQRRSLPQTLHSIGSCLSTNLLVAGLLFTKATCTNRQADCKFSSPRASAMWIGLRAAAASPADLPASR